MDAQQIFWIFTTIFSVITIMLFAFPVSVYEKAKETNLPDWAKGLFAQSIISYYHIKKHGFSAEGSDWAYCLTFNLATSFVITFLIAFGIAIILTTIFVLLTLLVLAAMLNSK